MSRVSLNSPGPIVLFPREGAVSGSGKIKQHQVGARGEWNLQRERERKKREGRRIQEHKYSFLVLPWLSYHIDRICIVELCWLDRKMQFHSLALTRGKSRFQPEKRTMGKKREKVHFVLDLWINRGRDCDVWMSDLLQSETKIPSSRPRSRRQERT